MRPCLKQKDKALWATVTAFWKDVGKMQQAHIALRGKQEAWLSHRHANNFQPDRGPEKTIGVVASGILHGNRR